MRASGVGTAAATAAADVFLRASIRQVGHHDIHSLPQRLRLLRDRMIVADAEIREISHEGAVSAFDGGGALGEYCVSTITDRAVADAAHFGVALATVRHSNHFLAAAPYAEKALESNCLAIVWSNTDPCMGSPDATARVIGNNPIGFAAPSGGDHPFLLDIAMAYASLGTLGERRSHNQPVPPHWGRDDRGRFSTDAGAILDGGVPAPMGEHKGFGLAMMHEVLTAGLSGGEMCTDVVPVGGWRVHSQTVLAINLNRFGGSDDLGRRVASAFSAMQDRAPALRMPGARSGAAGDDSRRHGIPISDQLAADLCRWSDLLEVAVPIELPDRRG